MYIAGRRRSKYFSFVIYTLYWAFGFNFDLGNEESEKYKSRVSYIKDNCAVFFWLMSFGKLVIQIKFFSLLHSFKMSGNNTYWYKIFIARAKAAVSKVVWVYYFSHYPSSCFLNFFFLLVFLKLKKQFTEDISNCWFVFVFVL